MIPFSLALLQAQTVPLTPFVDDGGTKTHPIDPMIVRLTKGVATLRVGTKGYRVWLRPGPNLIVDRNGNGRAEPSERIRLETRRLVPNGSPVTLYLGSLALPGNVRYDVRFVDSNTNNAEVQRLRNALVLMPTSGYVGKASFGGKAMRFAIRGSDPQSAALFVDRDGDGVLGTVPAEMFTLSEPFNIGGTTYKAVSYQPGLQPSIRFTVSPRRVAEVFMPPDLRVGKIAPSLTGRTLAGKPVKFPKGFPGKVVLMDVWATWCGPCRAEIPYIRDAYAKYRKRGFEVVSFSIDDPGTQKQVAAFIKANGTNWTQVFEGKGWQSPVCQRYNIKGIPFVLLVDGSTGKILATEEYLRGPRLAATLEGVLAMRGR
ncbi:TlpA family protein disulfide reductase [bacterium]|nr:MAG: TlpA family protein disulfide reductase [bacterium]